MAGIMIIIIENKKKKRYDVRQKKIENIIYNFF